MSPHAETLHVIGSQTLVAETLADPEFHDMKNSAAWLRRISRNGLIIAAVARLAKPEDRSIASTSPPTLFVL